MIIKQYLWIKKIISRCSAQPVLCYQDGGPVVEVLASSRDPLALLSWRLTSSSALASSTFSLQSMTRFVVYKHFTGTQYYNIMKIENVPKNPHKNHEGREHCCFWLRQQVDQCPRAQWKICLKGDFFIIIFSIRKYDLDHVSKSWAETSCWAQRVLPLPTLEKSLSSTTRAAQCSSYILPRERWFLNQYIYFWKWNVLSYLNIARIANAVQCHN